MPYIEKKIGALNSISKLFDKKSKASKEVKPSLLAEWLANTNIINYIFKEAKHPELITRSNDLLSFLALHDKLSKEIIDMLWETCMYEHKHEAVAEATLGVIANLAKILSEDMLQTFIAQIENLPISIFGEYINTFKIFYFN